MKPICPYCSPNPKSDPNFEIVAFGSFMRKSDSRKISRFKCLRCKKTFSRATSHPCYRQKKRHFNHAIGKLLSSGLSLRRLSLIFQISRTTVSRKLIFLGNQSRMKLYESNRNCSQVETMEFDDLETFEHTKCKPLSVTLAVESKTRRILGFSVSKMPAKGHLAEISRKKYGRRVDERQIGRHELFSEIKPFLNSHCQIKSDENPYYINDIKKFFPTSYHERFKGQRGCITGQGELKKMRFDPLFSLNHTCAMLRANINRLFRKTWCTTKRPERLSDHLAIYACFHNQVLIKI
jgi:transposase-like protein